MLQSMTLKVERRK